ncbi:MAG: recombination regulator RecX [Methylotenera sp.]|uniref:recombination regulator RecX n=1 Tax=Methylotenera sp. TaxID=2051956 RepID=UPI000D406CAA|nr:recombination regulator RecX [Methylotenera sp.]PPC82901.1 MAG: recombination regulator RecX [Methylotenera sp.]
MRTTKEFAAKSLRQRALDYLAKREYSYIELGKKLQAYADENDDIQSLLDDFKSRGWLSDQRFTEQIVHARKAKFGTAKIAHELREKGIADHLISDAVATLKATELENATEVWRKKFKTAPQTREEWAKQARFLQSRGFGFELIKKILSVNDND